MMTVEAVGPAQDGCEVRLGDFILRACGGDTAVRGEANVVVRPERVEVRPHQADRPENCLPGLVDQTAYVGSSLQLMIRLASGAVIQSTRSNTGGGAEQHSQGPRPRPPPAGGAPGVGRRPGRHRRHRDHRAPTPDAEVTG